MERDKDTLLGALQSSCFSPIFFPFRKTSTMLGTSFCVKMRLKRSDKKGSTVIFSKEHTLMLHLSNFHHKRI